MSVLSSKARAYLIDVLDRATPFKGFLELGADLAAPLLLTQFDNLVLQQYVEEGYQDEVNRFVEALAVEDLDAAKTELDALTAIIPDLPFLHSPKANDLFYKSLNGLMQAAIEEILWRKEHQNDES